MRNREMPAVFKALLFLAMAMSSFVFMEPAPYDLLMMLLMLSGLLFSLYEIKTDLILPILLLLLFFLSNLISMYFVKELGSSVLYAAITFYLGFIWLGIVGFGERYGKSFLELIMNGYLLAACIAGLLGTLAYFHLLPNSEMFLLYERAKALFKDPNVYGPFLVIPAVYTLYKAESELMGSLGRICYILLFLFLSSALLLSFSRAAWGNLAISVFIYTGVMKREALFRRIKLAFVLVLLGVPILLYFLTTSVVGDLLIARLSLQQYDAHRFAAQEEAFVSGFDNPIGWGPGQSETIMHMAPHSLFARLVIENGFLGLFTFLSLLLLSMHRAFMNYWYMKDEQGTVYLMIFACLIGLAFNSFFVDTLHWRHFWILLALPWVSIQSVREGNSRWKEEVL